MTGNVLSVGFGAVVAEDKVSELCGTQGEGKRVSVLSNDSQVGNGSQVGKGLQVGSSSHVGSGSHMGSGSQVVRCSQVCRGSQVGSGLQVGWCSQVDGVCVVAIASILLRIVSRTSNVSLHFSYISLISSILLPYSSTPVSVDLTPGVSFSWSVSRSTPVDLSLWISVPCITNATERMALVTKGESICESCAIRRSVVTMVSVDASDVASSNWLALRKGSASSKLFIMVSLV